MSFYKYPSAAAVNPVGRDPVCTVMGREYPGAGGPDIASAVPAVIARGPDVFAAGGRNAVLHEWPGRRDPDVDFGGGGKRKTRANDSGEE